MYSLRILHNLCAASQLPEWTASKLCCTLLRPLHLFPTSKSWSLILHRSLSSCFSSVAALSASLFALPATLEPGVFLYFTAVPTASNSAEICPLPFSLGMVPRIMGTVRRHTLRAAATGFSWSNTNLYFSIFLCSLRNS